MIMNKALYWSFTVLVSSAIAMTFFHEVGDFVTRTVGHLAVVVAGA